MIQYSFRQVDCTRGHHAPAGCLQWHTGNTGAGTVEAFNYRQETGGHEGHLAGVYNICIRCPSCSLSPNMMTVFRRRETGRCGIAWTPPAYSDDVFGFSVTGGATSQKARGACTTNDPAIGSCNSNQYVWEYIICIISIII